MRPSCRQRFARPESTFERIAFLVLMVGLIGMTFCALVLTVVLFLGVNPSGPLPRFSAGFAFIFLLGAVLSLWAEAGTTNHSGN